MALSDQLMDLASRTKRLEEAVAAVRAKNLAKLEEQRKQLQSTVDAQAQTVRAELAQAKTEAQGWWAETTTKIEQRRAEFEAKREQHKAERAIEAEGQYADAAEEFATMLTSLAGFVTDAAASAVVDAAIAREQADALKTDEAKVGS